MTIGACPTPTAGASGPWYDLHDFYSDGTASQEVVLGGVDGQSGVRRVALEEVGHGEMGSSVAPCPPRTILPQLCGGTYSATIDVDPSGLAEGAHDFRATATDLAGNTGTGDVWTVSVDRTASSTPSDFEQGLFYPSDPDPAVSVSWASSDPALPGGAAGSGVAAGVVRYRLDGGAYTAWQNTDGSSVEVPGVAVGTVIDVQAQSVDAVGNTSAVGTGTVTVAARNEDPAIEAAKAQAYQADYGGTLPAAMAWMAVQDRASGLGDVVSASSSGAGYAGVWMDNANQKVVVNLKTGTNPTGAQSALSAAGLTADSQIAYVAYTQQQLDDAYDVLVTDLDDILASQVIRLQRDDVSNAIAIEVGTDATTTQRSRITSAASSSLVSVTVTNSSEPNFQTQELSCVERPDPTGLIKDGNGKAKPVPICDPPVRGGIFASPQLAGSGGGTRACTTAFTATVPGSGGNPPTYYLMTAGHCTDGLSGGTPQWYGYWSDGSKNLLGPAAARVHDQRGDAGLIGPIDANSYWRVLGDPRPWVYLRSSGTGTQRRTTQYRVRRVDYSHKGDYVCVSGSASGGHCGKVTAIRQGKQNYGTIDLCGVRGGDSGGPVVSAGSARGIMVRNTSNVLGEDKCRVDFQSARIAQTLLDVQIMTHYPQSSP